LLQGRERLEVLAQDEFNTVYPGFRTQLLRAEIDPASITKGLRMDYGLGIHPRSVAVSYEWMNYTGLGRSALEALDGLEDVSTHVAELRTSTAPDATLDCASMT
jgi:hypothetical protein